MMAGIRGRDTKIETAVRRALFARGFRYRIDVRALPGRPDIVLPRYRAAVFVHGCFWHAHSCSLYKVPASRPEFWREKLESNARRDTRNVLALRAAGWRVAAIWECALRGKGIPGLDRVVDRLTLWLRGTDPLLDIVG
jgi:DNA mismatch endonuclease (patch repair protein)